jgi:hypothetical protein
MPLIWGIENLGLGISDWDTGIGIYRIWKQEIYKPIRLSL